MPVLRDGARRLSGAASKSIHQVLSEGSCRRPYKQSLGQRPGGRPGYSSGDHLAQIEFGRVGTRFRSASRRVAVDMPGAWRALASRPPIRVPRTARKTLPIQRNSQRERGREGAGLSNLSQGLTEAVLGPRTCGLRRSRQKSLRRPSAIRGDGGGVERPPFTIPSALDVHWQRTQDDLGKRFTMRPSARGERPTPYSQIRR